MGVSQPYLFRLFPDKKAIFARRRPALHGGCAPQVIEEAAEGLEGEEALHAMADAYAQLIGEHPERLQMQMQTYVDCRRRRGRGRP